MARWVAPKSLDWSKPLRLVKTGRQVYHKGFDCEAARVGLGEFGGSEFYYTETGQPYAKDCPWGAIENFNLADAELLTIEEVAAPAEAASRKIIAEGIEKMRDNPLWGSF